MDDGRRPPVFYDGPFDPQEVSSTYNVRTWTPPQKPIQYNFVYIQSLVLAMACGQLMQELVLWRN